MCPSCPMTHVNPRPGLWSILQLNDWNGSHDTSLHVLKVRRSSINQDSWVLKFLFWLLNNKILLHSTCLEWAGTFSTCVKDTVLTRFSSYPSSCSFSVPLTSSFLPPWPCVSKNSIHFSSSHLLSVLGVLIHALSFKNQKAQATSSYNKYPLSIATWATSERHLKLLMIFPHT